LPPASKRPAAAWLMSIYIDADAFARWEKGEFDLLTFMEERADEPFAFPATVWQQLTFGIFAWAPDRAAKRNRSLLILAALPVVPFSRAHALRAAKLAADLRLQQIGFADFQIAATALEDRAELLTFNLEHFSRVPGLRLVKVD
jgi:predicted nucleic acid-binding protein